VSQVRPARVVLGGLLFASATLGGCDQAGTYKNCTDPADPAPGSQKNDCPPSTFVMPHDVAWRDVSGIVWKGNTGVNGAVLSLSPLATQPNVKIISALAGINGFFGPLHDLALEYDLTVRADSDVMVVRGATTRYVQPAFEGPDNLTAGWSKRISIATDPPLGPGRTLALFATGTTAIAVTGDLDSGLSLVDKDYAANATIHAVEYEKGKDLTTATAYGKADVFVSASVPQPVPIHLDPIAQFAETKLVLDAPPGFSATTADLALVYSPTSLAHLTTMTLGVTIKLPVIPNRAAYAYHVRATAPDGAVAESGEQALDFGQPEVKASLLPSAVLESPADGASIDRTMPLQASGSGILEHVLVPASGTGSLRIITRDSTAILPDPTLVGGSVPTGKYTWTVRNYPGITFVDNLGGADPARYERVSTSAPRTVVIR
jgi:hypothetical protein